MSVSVTQVSSGPASYQAVDLSADGRYALVAQAASDQSHPDKLTLTNTATGAEQTVFQAQGGQNLTDVTMSADGDHVLYSVYPGTLYLWDRASGTTQTLQTGSPGGEVSSLTISGDGSKVGYSVYNADFSSNFSTIDTRTGEVRTVATSVRDAILSEDGRYAAYQTASGELVRQDLATGNVDVVASGTYLSDLSADGQRMLFSTTAALDPRDTDPNLDLYVKDFQTGAVVLVSEGPSFDGARSGVFYETAQLSDDGTRVLYRSSLSEGGPQYILSKDVDNGAVGVVAKFDFPLLGGDYAQFSMSGDGLTVLMDTREPLLPSDGDTRQDVYLLHYGRPSLTINPISGDGYVNSADKDSPVSLTGTSDAIGGTVQVISPSGARASGTVGSDGKWTLFVGAAGVSDGVRGFTVTVTDTSGIASTETKNAIFDTTPPTLLFFGVTDDNALNATELGTTIVLGGLSDVVGRSVTVSVDGDVVGSAPVGSAQPGGLGVWTLDYDTAGLTEGQHEVVLTARDAAGNLTRTETHFEVDTTPPTLVIAAIADDNVVTQAEAATFVRVNGTSDAIGQTVTIYLGDAERGSAVVASDGTWSADVYFQGAGPQQTVRATVADPAGNQTDANATAFVDTDIVRVTALGDGAPAAGIYKGEAIPSADGRYVVFSGESAALGGDAEISDIWLKDVVSGEVEKLTLGLGGGPANGSSYDADFTSNGRYVAFSSTASNLVAGDTNHASDTFLLDLQTGELTRVDTTAGGAELTRGSTDASVSGDGRYVAFVSDDSALDPRVQAGTPAIFVKDMVTGSVTLSSLLRGGTAGINPSLSDDGRYLAFARDISNGLYGTLLRDLQTGSEKVISGPSYAADFVAADGGDQQITADGRYVLFTSGRTDLVHGADDGFNHAYRYDRVTNTTELVDVHSGLAGFPEFLVSAESISDDGRTVAVLMSVNFVTKLYTYDMQTGQSRLVSTGGAGYDVVDAAGGTLSSDGRYIAFTSAATDLLPGVEGGSYSYLKRLAAADTLMLDPVAGDDIISADEAAALGGSLPLSGSTTAAAGSVVTLRIDGTVAGSTHVAAGGGWTFAADLSHLAAGRHDVVASVSDAAGFTASDGAIILLEVEQEPENNAGSLVITGLVAEKAREGQPIVVTVNDLDGIAGAVTYTFRAADGALLQSGTSGSYTPGAADRGGTITIGADYTDGAGHAEHLISVPFAVGNGDGSNLPPDVPATAAPYAIVRSVGADGSSIAARYDGAGELSSIKVTAADASVDFFKFEDTVLVTEVQMHPDESRDVYHYGIEGRSFVSSHASFAPEGDRLELQRLHADGTLDYAEQLDPVTGTRTIDTYDADGTLTRHQSIRADGSVSVEGYSDGVLVRTVEREADGSREVDRLNIEGKSYVAVHVAYDADGSKAWYDQTLVDGSHSQSALRPGVTLISTPTVSDILRGVGGDAFAFSSGFGHDTIIGFHAGAAPGHDTLMLDAADYSGMGDVAIQGSGRDTLLTLDDGDTILLKGIAAETLTSENFVFETHDTWLA